MNNYARVPAVYRDIYHQQYEAAWFFALCCSRHDIIIGEIVLDIFLFTFRLKVSIIIISYDDIVKQVTHNVYIQVSREEFTTRN